MKGDAQVGGLAKAAVRAPIPAAEETGVRVLPHVVLVTEQRLLQAGREWIVMLHMANNESLDGGDADVEFVAIIEAGFPDI